MSFVAYYSYRDMGREQIVRTLSCVQVVKRRVERASLDPETIEMLEGAHGLRSPCDARVANLFVSEDGAIRFDALFPDQPSLFPDFGGEFRLIPTVEAGDIKWQCIGEVLKGTIIPVSCRSEK